METAPIQEADVICLCKEKARLSFVRAQGDITSYPCPSPFLCCSQLGGWGCSPLANVTLSLTKLLDLVCLPDSIAKWKTAPGRGDQSGWGGVRSWPGGPYSHSAQRFYISFSNPDAGLWAECSPRTMLSALNTVDRSARQCNCGHFFLCRVGFSLMVYRKAGLTVPL